MLIWASIVIRIVSWLKYRDAYLVVLFQIKTREETGWSAIILTIYSDHYLLLYLFMNVNNYDVKLGSWYQGLVLYVMERKVYRIYHLILGNTSDNDNNNNIYDLYSAIYLASLAIHRRWGRSVKVLNWASMVHSRKVNIVHRLVWRDASWDFFWMSPQKAKFWVQMGASSTKSVQWSRTLDPHMSLTESSEHSAVCLQNEDPAWRCGTGSDLGGTGEQVRAASCIQVVSPCIVSGTWSEASGAHEGLGWYGRTCEYQSGDEQQRSEWIEACRGLFQEVQQVNYCSNRVWRWWRRVWGTPQLCL